MFAMSLDCCEEKSPNYYRIYEYQEMMQKTFTWVITNFNHLVFIKQK